MNAGVTTDAIRIANLLGLDVNNAQHTLAIVDSLNGIDDVQDFIAYIRQHKDWITFVSKTEKLDTLASRYRQKIEDAEVEDRSKSGTAYSVILARKVKQCRAFVENRSCLFRDVVSDGERFFKDHELRALAEVGGTHTIIELSRNGELEDRILEVYKKRIRQKIRSEKLIASGKKREPAKVMSYVDKALGKDR